jgi:hypothetical protein
VACLVHTARMRARDDLAEMLCKRVAANVKRARAELEEIRLRQRAVSALEEQRSEKYRHGLIAVVSIGFGQVDWAGPMPGSCPTWYLTHEYVGRDQTCDLQELQVAPLTVPLFLEGRVRAAGCRCRRVRCPGQGGGRGGAGRVRAAGRRVLGRQDPVRG